MYGNLDIKHIFNCLELAFQLDISDLKQKSIDFATKNIKKIQESAEWAPLVRRNPEISITLMDHLTTEYEKLKNKITELETQKCPHCRFSHEILLRRDCHLQRARRDARQGNIVREDVRPAERGFDPADYGFDRHRRERQNLPPMEQLPDNERRAIMAQAYQNRLRRRLNFENVPEVEYGPAPREIQNRIRAVENGREDLDRLLDRFNHGRPAVREEIDDRPPPERRRRYPHRDNIDEANDHPGGFRYVPREFRHRQGGDDEGIRVYAQGRRSRHNADEIPQVLRFRDNGPRRDENQQPPGEPAQRLQVIEIDESDHDEPVIVGGQQQPELNVEDPVVNVISDNEENEPAQPARQQAPEENRRQMRIDSTSESD